MPAREGIGLPGDRLTPKVQEEACNFVNKSGGAVCPVRAWAQTSNIHSVAQQTVELLEAGPSRDCHRGGKQSG